MPPVLRPVLIAAALLTVAPGGFALAACEPTIARPCPSSNATPQNDQSNTVAKRLADERKKRDSNVEVKVNGSVTFEGGTGGGTRF